MENLVEYKIKLSHNVVAENRPKVDSDLEAGKVCRQIVDGEPQEVFAVVGLDSQNRVVGYRVVHRGALSMCPVDVSTVLRAVLSMPCCGFLITHNHPSGDPTPSHEDLVLTNKLKQAADFVNVSLLDHIIVGDTTVSFMAQGLL